MDPFGDSEPTTNVFTENRMYKTIVQQNVHK